ERGLDVERGAAGCEEADVEGLTGTADGGLTKPRVRQHQLDASSWQQIGHHVERRTMEAEPGQPRRRIVDRLVAGEKSDERNECPHPEKFITARLERSR